MIAGIVLRPGLVGAVALQPSDPLVSQLAELALFAVLFTDGMRIGLSDLLSAWHLPSRALLVGMPLTLAGTAALAHFVARLPWLEAFLLGAALAPHRPRLRRRRTVATAASRMRAAFEEVSDLIAELLKVGRPARVRRAHLPDFLADISPSGYVFAALALLAVRPAALGGLGETIGETRSEHAPSLRPMAGMDR